MREPRFDFIGRSRLWLWISVGVMLFSIAGILIRGINFSIDFEGGTSFSVQGMTTDASVQDISGALEDAGAEDVRVQLVTDDTGGRGVLARMEAVSLDGELSAGIEGALSEVTGSQQISESFVGPTWGRNISNKALQALVVFLVIVALYISVRLQPKMAGGAIVALVHDIVVSVGLYAWFGFSFSPNTVIALLTILGLSLYDTVVVFDRVDENMVHLGEPGHRTYAQLMNTSLNEVVVRSIHTSMMSLLPVLAVLVVGSGLLGAETLRDLSLALFIGMALGIYSSLFVAGPLVSWWVSREPEMTALVERFSGSGEEIIAPVTTVRSASRHPITTEYVRGPGKGKRRRR